MARLLLFAADHTAGEPVAPLLLLVVVVVLVVAAVVVSLCTSSTHEKLWGQQRGSSSTAPLAKADSSVGASSRKRMLSATLSGIGGKAARMVSWNRRSPAHDGGSSDDEEAVPALGPDDDEAVWRKAIIMGDKCRPLQFSGHIAFDSDGNQLPPPPAATKKLAGPDVHAENQSTSPSPAD